MIDWIEILKTVEYTFDNDYEIATVDYEHPICGKLSMSYQGNKSKIMLVWNDCDHICFCKDKDPRLTFCDCDWDAFPEATQQRKLFTKKQYQELTAPNLFT